VAGCGHKITRRRFNTRKVCSYRNGKSPRWAQVVGASATLVELRPLRCIAFDGNWKDYLRPRNHLTTFYCVHRGN